MILQETESMRVTMEPLLYAAGVDIVLNGHLHEYERTHAIYVSFNILSKCTLVCSFQHNLGFGDSCKPFPMS